MSYDDCDNMFTRTTPTSITSKVRPHFATVQLPWIVLGVVDLFCQVPCSEVWILFEIHCMSLDRNPGEVDLARRMGFQQGWLAGLAGWAGLTGWAGLGLAAGWA